MILDQDREATKILWAVGCAHSDWGRLEAILTLLFTSGLRTRTPLLGARAYWVPRSFKTQIAMIDEVLALSCPAEKHPEFADGWETFKRSILGLSDRRNRLAHGTLMAEGGKHYWQAFAGATVAGSKKGDRRRRNGSPVYDGDPADQLAFDDIKAIIDAIEESRNAARVLLLQLFDILDLDEIGTRDDADA